VPTLARHGGLSAPAALPAAPAATAACASFPEVGKHIVFDGRLLHGVLREMVPIPVPPPPPPPLEPDPPPLPGVLGVRGTAKRGEAAVEAGSRAEGVPETSGCREGRGRRVTFLGNVWLNHRPKGVRALPEGMIPSLRAPTSMPLAVAVPTPIIIPQPECAPPPPPLLRLATGATDGGKARSPDSSNGSGGGGDGGGGSSGGEGGGGVEGWAEMGCYFGWSGDDLTLSGLVPAGLLMRGGRAPGPAPGLEQAQGGSAEIGTVRVVLPEAGRCMLHPAAQRIIIRLITLTWELAGYILRYTSSSLPPSRPGLKALGV
jgi:hypothetical protein